MWPWLLVDSLEFFVSRYTVWIMTTDYHGSLYWWRACFLSECNQAFCGRSWWVPDSLAAPHQPTLINPFGCSMLQRGRKLQAGGWYPLGYASSPITVVIQLQIPFIFEKPRNFITLCWPIWYSVVIKRRNRRAPGDHNWVLGHIADCDVFGGINSYKARVVMGKRQEAQCEKQIPIFGFMWTKS